MYFTERINYLNKGHEDLSFVDINLSRDTALFIDPYLLEVNEDSLSKQAKKIIVSFFGELYRLYRDPENNKQLIFELFDNCHEINDTKLGYGNGKNGKGKTAEGMIRYFENIPYLLRHNIPLEKELDVLYFAKGIAEDCLSDIITNLLFDLLNEFTINEAKKLGIENKLIDGQTFYYWDIQSKSWLEKVEKRLVIDDKNLLLVPKQFVCKRFGYNVEHYFRHIVAEHIIDRETMILPDGTELRPKKKELFDRFRDQNRDLRDVNLEETSNHPELLSIYQRKIDFFYRNRKMTNEELDEVMYGVNVGKRKV